MRSIGIHPLLFLIPLYRRSINITKKLTGLSKKMRSLKHKIHFLLT
jgi:hypothetical protein